MAACSTCRAPIFWRRNIATNKAIPVDRVPVVGGNVVLVGDAQCRFLSRDAAAGADVTTYTSHFATCPNSGQHRKPKT